jgi:hypothetical protein
MKIKLDFITNSSSASFFISRKDITDQQLLLILNWRDAIKSLNFKFKSDWDDETTVDYDDRWSFDVTDNFVKGFTAMDNNDFEQYIKFIGINTYSYERD